MVVIEFPLGVELHRDLIGSEDRIGEAGSTVMDVIDATLEKARAHYGDRMQDFRHPLKGTPVDFECGRNGLAIRLEVDIESSYQGVLARYLAV